MREPIVGSPYCLHVAHSLNTHIYILYTINPRARALCILFSLAFHVREINIYIYILHLCNCQLYNNEFCGQKRGIYRSHTITSKTPLIPLKPTNHLRYTENTFTQRERERERNTPAYIGKIWYRKSPFILCIVIFSFFVFVHLFRDEKLRKKIIRNSFKYKYDKY